MIAASPLHGAHSGGKLGSTFAPGFPFTNLFHTSGKLGTTSAPLLAFISPFITPVVAPECALMSTHVFMSPTLFMNDETCTPTHLGIQDCRNGMRTDRFMSGLEFMGAASCPACLVGMSKDLEMATDLFMGEDLCIRFCTHVMSEDVFMDDTIFMGQDTCIACDLFMDDDIFVADTLNMGEDQCPNCRGLVVTNLRVDRAFEGPQLLVAWDEPEKAEIVWKIRVVRKKFSFPQNVHDGAIIFTGDPIAGAVSDVDLEECDCYYYSVFSQRTDGDHEWCTNPTARIIGMPVKTGFFPQRLLSLLPELYINADRDTTRLDHDIVPLSLEVDPLNGERFNLLEDGVTRKGSLERYIKILGIALDDAKGLIDCLPQQFHDVDEICADRLSLLAAIVGLDLNTELPIDRQRQEIKTAVEIWKLKGTATSVKAKARAISRVDVEVDNFCDNILVTNRLDRTVMSSDFAVTTKFGLLGDPTSYVIAATSDKLYNPFTFGLFFQMPNGESVVFDPLVIDKIQRILDLLTPVCREGKIIQQDQPEVEAVPDPTDDFEDVHETLHVERVYENCWLFTPTSAGAFLSHVTATATVPLPFRTTLTLGAFKGDSFFDTILP